MQIIGIGYKKINIGRSLENTTFNKMYLLRAHFITSVECLKYEMMRLFTQNTAYFILYYNENTQMNHILS